MKTIEGGPGMELAVKQEYNQNEMRQRPAQTAEGTYQRIPAECSSEQKSTKPKIWTPILALPGIMLLGVGGLLLIIGMTILCVAACIVGSVLLCMSNLSNMEKPEANNDSLDREIQKRIG